LTQITLKSGGILERNKWNGEKQEYEITDVTDIAYYYLNSSISFSDDVILKDVFLLIDKHIDLFKLIFNNHIEEYTHDALNNPDLSTADQGIDYCELSWYLDIYKKDLEIPSWPHFGGIGVCKKTDQNYKEGETIHWGLSFTPIENLVKLPLKLSEIIEFNGKTYYTSGYTLYHVIQGIMWEMSWEGSPAQSQKKLLELQEMCRKIDSGEEKLIPWPIDDETQQDTI
jgi:hypothetical protein